MKKRQLQTFSHKIVAFLMVNSVIWVYCSYGLAYLGRADIAETLSKTVITEIIAVILVYSLKSLFENISKNTDWPAKNIPDVPEDKNKENYY